MPCPEPACYSVGGAVCDAMRSADTAHAVGCDGVRCPVLASRMGLDAARCAGMAQRVHRSTDGACGPGSSGGGGEHDDGERGGAGGLQDAIAPREAPAGHPHALAPGT
eukprot:2894450-Rhodomonas_salina.1